MPDFEVTEFKVSDMLTLDYMGSAEFEYGAVPKSIRAMTGKDLKVYNVALFKEEVFLICTEEEVFALTASLYELATDQKRTKERISFSQHFQVNAHREYFYGGNDDFWWDIEAQVAWTFSKPAANNFIEALKESVRQMDQKKQEKTVSER